MITIKKGKTNKQLLTNEFNNNDNEEWYWQ